MSIITIMKNKSKKRKEVQRLGRNEWLHNALEILAEKGPEKLRLHTLVKEMGVTTGSFYWHFKNMADFITSLVEYWINWSTLSVIKELENIEGDGKDRLFVLAQIITSKELAKYDIAIRSLALGKPTVTKIVKKSDSQRLTFVRKLFTEIGFEGDELEARVRLYFCFFSLENGILIREPQKKRLERLQTRVEILTRS
jgi:AcrR family transcriptional regulator